MKYLILAALLTISACQSKVTKEDAKRARDEAKGSLNENLNRN